MTAINFYQLKEKDKLNIFNEVAKKVPLPLASIEKDWWVVQTLDMVFQMEAAPHLVFKGGTSLSKAWGLIERFSEDIDLALSREFLGYSGNISRTQVGKLRDASFKYISETFLPELKELFYQKGIDDVKIELIEVKTPDQDPVKIAINYTSITQQSNYVPPRVVLEIGSRAMREPYTDKEFCSFVGAIFKEQAFADSNIIIPCVNPERTYLEKLFLLHEEFQRPKEKIRVNRLSRHLYDIQRISNTEFAKEAISNKALYTSIVEHRKHFSKLGGVDYTTHFPPQLNPFPSEELLDQWERDYQDMQNEMIYGKSLSFVDLLEDLKRVVREINGKIF